MTPRQALDGIWALGGLPAAVADDVTFTDDGPCVPSSFRVATAAAATVAASGLAASALWKLRTGRSQGVTVAPRHACAAFRSEQYLMLDGRAAYPERDWMAGLFPTGSDGWVRLHTNFAHHRMGIERLLGGATTREAMAAAVSQWESVALEEAAARAGLAASAMRRFDEWDAHPQGQAVPQQPLVSITRVGDWPAEPMPEADTPLGGIRVLDLTRVIAGPVCGRTLAAHGADVMSITGPGLPSYRTEDLGRGKLQVEIDLRTDDGQAVLAGLVKQADVFVQGYRPGAISDRGFGLARVSGWRPGIVYASLSAYGPQGPWADRRGSDSLVQTACGFNAAEAAAAGQTQPRPLPVQALDHASGYLMAFGIMAALHRRATEGGTWNVEVSLARTGQWLRELGRVDGGFDVPDLTMAAIDDLFEDSPSGFGPMRAIRHAALLSETPAGWARPSVALGSHQPFWP